MKLSEIQVGTEYAVVPSWTYSTKQAREVAHVRENDVVKATLISKDKYDYEPSRRKSDSSAFSKAESGNRSVGVIVKATDNNGQDFYWTSRLADIVAPYADLEPIWKAKKDKEDEETRKRKAELERAEEITRNARKRVEVARNSVIASSKELLGENCYVSVDTNGYGEDTKAVVTMSLNEYERLIELAYEGKALSA